MGPIGGAIRNIGILAAIAGLIESKRRPEERYAVDTARTIEAPPWNENCWQVGRRPLDAGSPIMQPIFDFLGDATKGLEHLNFNHVHLRNKGTGENVGFYPSGLGREEKPITFDTKFGNLCMDADVIENAMRNVYPGTYSFSFNNCQDYPDGLLGYIRDNWTAPAGGGGGGGI